MKLLVGLDSKPRYEFPALPSTFLKTPHVSVLAPKAPDGHVKALQGSIPC